MEFLDSVTRGSGDFISLICDSLGVWTHIYSSPSSGNTLDHWTTHTGMRLQAQLLLQLL